MTARSYSAANLVALPRLNVAGAIALGTEIVTCAKAHDPLPELIGKELARLEQAHTELRGNAKAQLGEEPGPSHAPEADRALDGCWSALFYLCTAWSKLPGANAAVANSVLESLFSDGLKFTQIPYKLEWSESQTRLDFIAENKLPEKLAALGATPFLDALRTAHQAYGNALGLTATKAEKTDAPSMREPLLAFADALRSYVLKVAALADPDNSSATDLSDALLAPVARWSL